MGFRPILAPTILRGFYQVSVVGNSIANNSAGNFDFAKLAGDDILDLSAPAAPTCLYAGLLSASYEAIGPNAVAAGLGIAFGLAVTAPDFSALQPSQVLLAAHNADLNDIATPAIVFAVDAGWILTASYDRGNDGGGGYTTGPETVFISQLVF